MQFFRGLRPNIFFCFATMHSEGAHACVGRGGFGVQRAPMRVRGGAVQLFQQRWCSYFGGGGGAVVCISCWSSALIVARGGGAMLHFGVFLVGRIRSVCEVQGWLCLRSVLQRTALVHLLWRGAGAQCYILAFFLLVAFGQFVRCRGGVVFVLCSRGPLGLARNTHRGARTHDHKVKGLALCRLS